MQYSSLDISKIWTSFKASRSLVYSVITLNDVARPKCKIFLSANSDNQYWLSTQHKLQRFSIRRHLFCCQQTQLQQTVKFYPFFNTSWTSCKSLGNNFSLRYLSRPNIFDNLDTFPYSKNRAFENIQKLQCKFKKGFFNIFCEKSAKTIDLDTIFHDVKRWTFVLTFFRSWENFNPGICSCQKSCLTSLYRLV